MMTRLSSFGASVCVASLTLFGAGIASAQDADPALVEQGHALAIAGDCAACHRDPATGNPFAGGYGVESPLGTIFGSNITPSKTAGIGSWTLDEFESAVRKGRVGTHFLYPAMPYTAFSGISDADMKALYSYFMLGVKPADHQVEKTDLGFPFNIRLMMAGWDMLFGGTSPAKATPQSGVERGRYLVDTLAHCSTCHTPRNELMAEDMGRYLGGGKVGSWTAPNISSDPVSGIGSWSEQDLFTYLKTGALHGKAIAAGEMGTAVQNSFSQMGDGDLHDIAAYIKSVPPVTNAVAASRSGWSKSAPQPVSTLENPIAETDYATATDLSKMTGAELYEGACATCHGYDGRGTPDHRLPSLVGSSAVGSVDASNLVMTITEGVNRTVAGEHVFMPAFGPQDTAFGPQFGPAQVAKVADYVATSFGEPNRHITEADVKLIYASATQKSWLIANIKMLMWIAIAVAAVFIIVVAGWLVARRRPDQVGHAT